MFTAGTYTLNIHDADGQKATNFSKIKKEVTLSVKCYNLEAQCGLVVKYSFYWLLDPLFPTLAFLFQKSTLYCPLDGR